MTTTRMPATDRTPKATRKGGTPPGGGPAEARLLRLAAAGALLAGELVRTLGVFSSAGWLLTAGLSLAMYSPISRGLAETGADTAVQKAAIQLIGVVITGALGFAAL